MALSNSQHRSILEKKRFIKGMLQDAINQLPGFSPEQSATIQTDTTKVSVTFIPVSQDVNDPYDVGVLIYNPGYVYLNSVALQDEETHEIIQSGKLEDKRTGQSYIRFRSVPNKRYRLVLVS